MTDNNNPVERVYTDEELTRAEEELKALNPIGYLELIEYVHQLENQDGLPEAGGIAFCELYGPHGNKINVTARGPHPLVAAESLLKAVKLLADRYHFTPSPVARELPAAPAALPVQSVTPQAVTQTPVLQPVYVNPAGQTVTPGQPLGSVAQEQGQQAGNPLSQSLEIIPVKSVRHVISQDGSSHYVRAMGGRFTKFGVPAYDEVIPKSVQYMLYPVGVDYQTPPEMAFMTVEITKDKQNHDKPKVIAFHATHP